MNKAIEDIINRQNVVIEEKKKKLPGIMADVGIDNGTHYKIAEQHFSQFIEDIGGNIEEKCLSCMIVVFLEGLKNAEELQLTSGLVQSLA